MTYDSLRSHEYERLLRDTVCMQNKHSGMTWDWVVRRDPDYAVWSSENIENMSDDLREAIEYGVEYLGAF